MILYSDDPKLGLKVITTITGAKEYRRNCKFIQGKFYAMEVDCFFVEGQWYRKESGKVEFDHEKKVWVLKGNHELTKGVVGFESNGAAIYGFYSPNVYNNCKVHLQDVGTSLCISTEILEANGYFEDVATCKWYNKAAVGASSFKKMTTIRNEVSFLNKGYNIEDNAVEFEQKKDFYSEYPTKIAKDVRVFAKFLGDTTFGAEIETSMGNISENLQYRTGIVACRDGSISSAEWVTVPMAGAKGVQNICDVADITSKRCELDINCSLHYHFGNIPKERLFLIALYVLAYKIQDEVFKMFPYYKTDHRGVKKKNYCQKLKKMQIHPLKDFSKEGYESFVEEVYVRIFTFLSDGHLPGEYANRKNQRHPIHNKWDRKSRYYWLNLQNMIFSERETAEFRLHTATTNKVKMTAWLFICNAILKFAENNIERILGEDGKIPFSEVLGYYGEHFPKNKEAKFLSAYLQAYYDARCKQFAKDLEKEDKISEHDIKNDKKFTFAYDGVTLF